MKWIKAGRSGILLFRKNVKSLPVHVHELESKPVGAFLGICEIWLIKANELLYALASFSTIPSSRKGKSEELHYVLHLELSIP